MAEVTVSVRVDEQLHTEMRSHDEVNWSAVLRKAIAEQVQKLEHIEKTRAQHALEEILAIRKRKLFDKGKQTTELIREWRHNRR